MKKTEQIDATNTNPAYWEKILKAAGLAMGRGAKLGRSRHTRTSLVYSGDTKDLDSLQIARLAARLGRPTESAKRIGTADSANDFSD